MRLAASWYGYAWYELMHYLRLAMAIPLVLSVAGAAVMLGRTLLVTA